MHYVEYAETDTAAYARMVEALQTSGDNSWRCKRAFDVVLSFCLLILLSPLLLLVCIAIFLDDPHASPLFSQVRVGRHGKEFTLYKFRTMVANAEALREELEDRNEMDGPVFKIKDDPRITRIGKFLRSTSIDELPQLFNVLRGDMSMVGPRPPLPSEVAYYNDYQRLRLVVAPGLTCTWQIAHNRNSIAFREWVEMDLDYIQNRTMWLDIKLILQTPFVMLRRGGS